MKKAWTFMSQQWNQTKLGRDLTTQPARLAPRLKIRHSTLTRNRTYIPKTGGWGWVGGQAEGGCLASGSLVSASAPTALEESIGIHVR